MFERVLLALDGPEAPDALLADLSRVFGSPEPEIVMLDFGAAFRPGMEELRARRVRRPSASAEAILEVARTSEASILATANPSRPLRGCPVPLLRFAAEPRELRTVLLPVDGSVDWKAAAACAVEIARRHEAQVIVLRTCAPERREAAGRMAREVCGELVAAGVVAYAFVEEGPSARAVVDAAAAHEVDLIVMAAEGPVEDVVREARIPVMAVPESCAKLWVEPARELVED